MLLEKNAELHKLQDELTNEKAVENAPAPNADAAVAPLKAEGRKPEKFSAAPTEEKTGTATEQLEASLRDDGELAAKLIDSGALVPHDTAQTLPTKNGAGKQGMTDADGKIHLVADQLTTESAPAVLLHEAFRAGVQKLIGGEAWNGLTPAIDLPPSRTGNRPRALVLRRGARERRVSRHAARDHGRGVRRLRGSLSCTSLVLRRNCTARMPAGRHHLLEECLLPRRMERAR